MNREQIEQGAWDLFCAAPTMREGVQRIVAYMQRPHAETGEAQPLTDAEWAQIFADLKLYPMSGMGKGQHFITVRQAINAVLTQRAIPAEASSEPDQQAAYDPTVLCVEHGEIACKVCRPQRNLNLRRDAHPDYLFSLYMRMAKAHEHGGWSAVTKLYVAEKEEMEKRFGYPTREQPTATPPISEGEIFDCRCYDCEYKWASVGEPEGCPNCGTAGTVEFHHAAQPTEASSDGPGDARCNQIKGLETALKIHELEHHK